MKQCMLAFMLGAACFHAQAQGTAFTYQGRLDYNAAPITGAYDLRFVLYDSASGGNTAGDAITNLGAGLSNGLFTVTLDFGPDVFNGAERWLEIGVRTNGADVFNRLEPRQRITASPYAVFAGRVDPANATTLTNQNNAFAGTFSGNGAGLTNVNAGALGGVAASGFWKLTGNTVAPGQFLGSTNNQPVEVWAHGYRVLRLEPDPGGSFAGNLIGGYTNNAIHPSSGGNVIAGGGWAGGMNLIHAGSRGNFIGAGSAHQIGPNMNDGVIGGGYGNIVQSFNAFVGSGRDNKVLPGSPNSGILGGSSNVISGNSSHATITGGLNNTNSAGGAHIGGGLENTVESFAGYSSIGGGEGNTVGGPHTTIAGGYYNRGAASYATVGGGYGNISSNLWDTIGGGFLNVARGGESFIGGGRFNLTTAEFATVGGGDQNASRAFSATVAGGSANLSAGQQATVGGGLANSNLANFGTISGGSRNALSGNAVYAAVGGGFSNVVVAEYSVVGGGLRNTIDTNAWASVIGGGARNILQPFAQYSVIGGGDINAIESNVTASVIGGGLANTIQTRAWYSTIGGGFNNYIWSNAMFATVAGGYINFIRTNAECAAIGGGQYNTVAPKATHATIPGGFQNTASAPFTFAAGNHAQANHAGAFVWADSSSSNNFSSTAENQFLIRASGGVGIGVTAPQVALHVSRLNGQLRLEDPAFNNHWNIYTEALGSPETSGNLLFVPGPTGVFAYIRKGDGNYFSGSDARLKADVQSMSNVLERVLRLRPVSYRFKSAPGSACRAVGLIAQEVQPHFPEVVDEHDGVKAVAYAALVPAALGAIQGLNEKVESGNQKAERRIQKLETENTELKRELAELKGRVDKLMAKGSEGAN